MDSRLITLSALLIILVAFSGCTTQETVEPKEITPDWLKECPDGTKIDASERCPDVPQEFSEATEKQIFYELIELQDIYAEECTDESGFPLDCYPINI